jgi:uncharacterized protein YcfJ
VTGFHDYFLPLALVTRGRADQESNIRGEMQMADPVESGSGEKPFLNTETIIGAVIGAIFGGAIEHIFMGQGATLVAAVLFGIAGAFVPMLFK